MPNSPKRPCQYPRCPNLVESGWCDTHKKHTTQHRYDAHRGSAASRGYDAQWRKYRSWFIARDPVCSDCEREAATDVHHIKKLADYPELRLFEPNCMGLCSGCHQIRTNRGE